MKKAIAAGLGFCLAVVAVSAAAETATPPDEAARVAKARVDKARLAIKDLAETMKGRLGEALKAGGPAAGMDTCSSIAQPMTRDVSAARGLTVRRTALQVRNPLNAPSGRERAVMQAFVEKMKAGADPATLEHVETLDAGGRKSLVVMKPIATAAEPCLACHGAAIKPEVQEQIRRLYPDDQATGFNAGDLRGAFVVTQPAE